MKLYLTVCLREQRTSKYFNETHLVQKGSDHLIKFRCCLSNTALPHKLVTMQGKGKFETFLAIRIDFIKKKFHTYYISIFQKKLTL